MKGGTQAAHSAPPGRFFAAGPWGLKALGLALLLSGCMVGPDYKRPAALATPAFKELAGWKPAAPADTAPRGAWWEIYHDPLLNTLASQVNVANQTLAADYAAYQNAQALVQEARAALYPTLGATASATRSASGGGGLTTFGNTTIATGSVSRSTYTLEGTASWTPDIWGQVRRQIESNVALAQASAATLANARLSAQAQLATAYFELRGSDAQIRLLSDTVKDYRRALQITQNQYDVGVAARSDVLTAQVQLESTEAQLTAQGIARAQYEHAIAVQAGRPPASLTIPPGTLSAIAPVPPVVVPSLLLQRRPDIAAAERTMKADNALIGVAIASFYPDISLSALGGLSADPVSRLFNAGSEVWTLAASGTETLFNGGLRSAEVKAARATYQEAVANYRQTVLSAFENVEDQLAASRILQQEAVQQERAVSDARRAVTIALNEYRAGTQAYTTVITAQNTALADEQSLISVRQSALVASVALVQALGGGWSAADLPTPGSLQRGSPLIPDALDGSVR